MSVLLCALLIYLQHCKNQTGYIQWLSGLEMCVLMEGHCWQGYIYLQYYRMHWQEKIVDKNVFSWKNQKLFYYGLKK